MTVWKFQLEITDTQTITMPAHAKILCVQTQYGKPKLWALVNADSRDAHVQRTIRIIGTGHEVGWEPENWHYIGTCQTAEGQLVWHVFVEVPAGG